MKTQFFIGINTILLISGILAIPILAGNQSGGLNMEPGTTKSATSTESKTKQIIDEFRHPHPHLDPRQPRDGAKPRTNPPVFAWKPIENIHKYTLTVAHDSAFNDICLTGDQLEDPCFLPETTFPAGTYFWKWSCDAGESPAFTLEITPDALLLEIPAVDEWFNRLSVKHPRVYVSPDQVGSLRSVWQSTTEWQYLKQQADSLLAEPHEIREPNFLPDRHRNYEKWFATWYPIMWDSRKFIKGSETLALTYLVSGERKYARAACERMASISQWDPEGSSYLGHNDEAHMSVIWHGPQACDWIWDEFTEAERALVIEQFRRRGQITYEHTHDRGIYGITRFGSHDGREIVFLAMIALVFHEHIPEAKTWLAWLRPVLCGIWPVWAEDDGAWAEGPSYGLAYVTIMTMFTSALKRAAGIDLYRRPFWRGHAQWRQWILPPYAEWIGFGDHSERWDTGWRNNADLVELIAGETGTPQLLGYVSEFREAVKTCPRASDERQMPGVVSQKFLLPAMEAGASAAEEQTFLRVFPGAGWAAIRTDFEHPEKDIAFIFRSSPYAAISHSHANNNDFIIHVGGKVMAMPSGYYSGYGSDHHSHWVWHTKSHNCLTLSDASQLMRSYESRGAIENAFEDTQLTYFRGNADASYSTRAKHCRRHVLFLKPHSCIVLIDEFEALPGIVSSIQWNIHSWNRFQLDEAKRRFRVEREGSVLEGTFIFNQNAFFSLSEGWDPPPITSVKSSDQWLQQYHLRFTISELAHKQNLGVVLCPGHSSLQPAKIATERIDGTEIAHIGDDLVLINQGEGIRYNNVQSDALAVITMGKLRYSIKSEGISEF
ncbi:DUF4962 domain-containing protein [candidate division KSB1 bacterium]|nr:DUF4962 domain-containing protein [candidate division KSB1 bacterium]